MVETMMMMIMMVMVMMIIMMMMMMMIMIMIMKIMLMISFLPDYSHDGYATFFQCEIVNKLSHFLMRVLIKAGFQQKGSKIGMFIF